VATFGRNHVRSRYTVARVSQPRSTRHHDRRNKIVFTSRAAAVAAAALVLAPATASAHHQPMSALDRHFAMAAAHSNNFEIVGARTALAKSQTPAVRAAARRVLRDHTMANAMLRPVAAQLHVRLPRSPNPLQKWTLARTARLEGRAFDVAFLRLQEAGHRTTISLFGEQVREGQNPHARRYAEAHLPGLRVHLQLVRQTLKSL
jgi:putative membrane protein